MAIASSHQESMKLSCADLLDLNFKHRIAIRNTFQCFSLRLGSLLFHLFCSVDVLVPTLDKVVNECLAVALLLLPSRQTPLYGTRFLGALRRSPVFYRATVLSLSLIHKCHCLVTEIVLQSQSILPVCCKRWFFLAERLGTPHVAKNSCLSLGQFSFLLMANRLSVLDSMIIVWYLVFLVPFRKPCLCLCGSNKTTVTMAPPSAPSSGSHVSYEAFAPRSAAQISRLQRIQAMTAGPTAQPVMEETGESDTWTLADAMTPPREQAFSQSSGSVQDSLKRTLVASDHETVLLKHTTSLRLALRASINIADDISNRHAELLRHSGELSAAADRLQAEEAMLTKHAEEIGKPLQHYDAVDRIGILVGVLFKGRATVRGLAKIKVDNEDYPDILDEIDAAVEFFGNESGGKEALLAAERRRSSEGTPILSGSIEYYRRSLALQDAALFLIKEAVAERVQQASADITSILNLHKTPIAADKLEASLIYTRFHGISARSNRLLALVRKRLSHGEAYHELLQLCRNTYCSCRENLLKATVRAHLDKLRNQHGLVGMTRLASVFLIRLCTVETSLYIDFFGEKKATEEMKTKEGRNTAAHSLGSQVMADDGTYYDAEFQAYLNKLCSALHRTVRRGLVTVLDLDTLCQIVSVLREERTMASSSPTTMAAARAISTVIEDAQERLIFCANNALNKEVIRFRATPDDLDYPAKLTKQPSETNEEDAVQKQLQVYESWFPPMRSVLRILSKIFRVVEPRVFEDIARESVQACTRCLKDGAAVILQKRGVVHADLFLVKHLLVGYLAVLGCCLAQAKTHFCFCDLDSSRAVVTVRYRASICGTPVGFQ